MSDARDLMCERVLRAKVTLQCICMFEGLSVIVCNQDMKLHIIVKIRVLSGRYRGHMGSVITARCGV